MDGNDGDELIRHADEALYESKRTGRNKVACYKAVEIGDSTRDPADDFGQPFTERDLNSLWGGDETS